MSVSYYGNKECEVLAVIGEESVIELLIGDVTICEDGSSWDEEPYVEPYHTKIIVASNLISSKPLTHQDIFDEQKERRREAAKEIKESRRIATSELSAERFSLKNEIEELHKRSKKYEGLSAYIDYLEGSVKYIVFVESYRIGITEIDELTDYDGELVSVSFRSQRSNKYHGATKMYVGQYSDDSGTKYQVIGCKTLEQAKTIYIDQIKNTDSISKGTIEQCDKWGIELECVSKRKLEFKEQERKNNEYEANRLKEQLAKLEEK